MKAISIMIVLAFAVLGLMLCISHDIDIELNKTKIIDAQILDLHVDKENLVLILFAEGKFYRIRITATAFDTSKPAKIIFHGSTPVAILQENETFAVLEYRELKNLEKMPEIKN